MEIWKDIKDYEGFYQVSNYGKVRSVDRIITFSDGRKRLFKGQNLNPAKTITGYLFVGLKKSGEIEQIYIHILVAIAFIPNTEDKETVNHKDGIKANNLRENLEWNTRSENTIHAYATGLMVEGEKAIWSKLTEKEILEIRENKNNLLQKDLAVIYNVCPMSISNIIRRKIWKKVK